MPELLVEQDGPITHLVLNRAEKYNALSQSLMEALTEAAEALRDDADCRAVIIRAAGDQFSYGADLDEVRARRAAPDPKVLARRQLGRGMRLLRAIREIHQPTICAIQGVATGGGACIAAASDFRIGDSTARVGYGEVKMGMNLMWNAVPDCVHLVGPSKAKQMIMSGDLVPAETLLHWGWIDACVAPDDLLSTAQAWAEKYAALPPVAVQMIKRSVNMVAGALDAAVMHMDDDQFLLANLTEDFKEATSAFMEKRPPKFSGD